MLPTGTEEPHTGEASLARQLSILPRRAGAGVIASAELAKRLVDMSLGRHSTVRAAMRTPRTPFNQPVTRHRRFATQVLELDLLKSVAKATDTTVNDVVLCALGGAGAGTSPSRTPSRRRPSP